MADEDPTGQDWSDGELDAIVTDYFSMLGEELAGRPYVKAHHNAGLVQLTGRSRGSVEFKYANVSAVLEELGMPWITGYKPRPNYQGTIFGAIDRYLSRNEVMKEAAEPRVPWIPQESLFVDPPALLPDQQKHPGLQRLIQKYDPAERDLRNRALGREGEKFVLRLEKEKLARIDRHDLADKVRWIADEEGDGAGFDILSFAPTGKEKLIEVKTTNGGARTPFFLSRNEHEVSNRRADFWQLYRVHLFAQTPSVFSLQPPLERWLRLRTETWRASFS